MLTLELNKYTILMLAILVSHWSLEVTTCSDDPCQNGAVCFTPGNSEGFFCVCTAGWTGDTCETTDYCEPDPCQNGGTCRNDPTNFACECPPGYLDNVCSIVDYCITNPCANSAPCGNNNDNTDFECDCGNEFLSKTCEIINHCDGDPCQNGRPCNNNNNDSGFVCTCGTDYLGDACEFQNFCTTFPCQNGGICSNNADNTDYICDCSGATGYEGPTCNDPIIPPPCDSDPCQNGASCDEENDGFICTCTARWMGTTCEIEDYCEPDPCANGASCDNNGDDSGFECDCAGTGFQGNTCEETIPSEAPIGSTIRPVTEAPGPGGCGGPDPCENGARCLSNVCVCVSGFTGDLCETNIDDCASTPCPSETSTCVDLVDGFSCACAPGYMGDLCNQAGPGENDAINDGPNLAIDPWWIALICLIIVMAVILMCLAVCTCRTVTAANAKPGLA